MKPLSLFLTSLFIHAFVIGQTNWKLDAGHSKVRFVVTHLVISEIEGSFSKFDGTVSHSKQDFTDAAIDFTVDVASIDTDNERRDTHLKSDDFFNAEKYPQMKFESTSFTKVSEHKYELAGNLTIRDVTKPVKFDVVYAGQAVGLRGNTKAVFKATTSINRFDYGLKWNNLTEAGGVAVGADVTIDLKLEFAKA